MNNQKPQHIRIHISHLLTEQEWRCIEIFQKRVQQLSDANLLSSNKTKISANFKFEVGKPFEFRSSTPFSEKDFKELVYALRFFYLQKEPCHFPTVVNIISKHCSDNDIVVQKLRDYKNRWNGSLFGETILFFHQKKKEETARLKNVKNEKVFFKNDGKRPIASQIFEALALKNNGEKLTAKKILDLWYNAEYSHSVEQKERELKELNQYLSFDLSKYMFVDVVVSLSYIVLEFFNVIKDLSRPVS